MSAMVQRIVDAHGDHVLRKSAVRIRDGAEIFERVLAGKGYGTVLEIGSFRGVSAAVMSQYCAQVVTVDLKHGDLEQHAIALDRRAFWQSLGVDNVELFLVADDIEKAALISSLAFDFAFIDAGKDDIATDFALVKRCGRVLFHDYDDRGQPSLNMVYDFVNSLPKEQVTVMDIFALWEAA